MVTAATEATILVVVKPREGKALFPLCKACKGDKKKTMYSKAQACSGSAGRRLCVSEECNGYSSTLVCGR